MNEFVAGLTQRLATTFDPARAGDVLAGLVEGSLVALAVLVAYYLGWRVLRVAIAPLLRRVGADATSATFAQTILKYGILVVGVVHALDAAGINTASILASLGVVGLTVGFAARDALSNVVSGILIYWDRPFVIGDLVDIDGSYGRVDRITLRSTRVVTSDGRMLAVPNTHVINSTVASYTNFRHLRIDVPVTVGVDEDLGQVRTMLLSAVTQSPGFMSDPAPRVVVTALNDYNVEVQIQAWLDDERQHVVERFALRERVYEILRKAGVDMPFETLQLRPVEVVGR